jgi:uncharacterized protein YggE
LKQKEIDEEVVKKIKELKGKERDKKNIKTSPLYIYPS